MFTQPAPRNPPGFVKVLLISSVSEDHVSLQHIFDHSNWLLHKVSTCRAALAFACENDIAVVICERDLPDGDWKLALSEFDRLPLWPNLIVTSRLANDEFWAEVLNLGGYDVLAQPFDSNEVYRVVFLAWHERERRASPARGAALKTAQVRADAG
jgi:DNA-binding NtrC family response regulator